MEHREHYDPEDIEHLLETHSFNELIAEEKAFVLKHVSSEQEYEQMRGMRAFLKENIKHTDRIDPDPRMKANVLDAFRESKRQKPRIWLNSVLAMFSGSSSAMSWRPALQIASILLLVGAGFFAYTVFNEQPIVQEVAEVKTRDEFKNENKIEKSATEVVEKVEPSAEKVQERTITDSPETAKVRSSLRKEDVADRSKTALAERPAPSTLANVDIAADDAVVDGLDAGEFDAEELADEMPEDLAKDAGSSSNAATGAVAPVAANVPEIAEALEEKEMSTESISTTAARVRQADTKGLKKAKELDNLSSNSVALAAHTELIGVLNRAW